MASTDKAPPLKLVALDADDLSVLSAHLQDAVLKVSEMAYLPAEKRFALVANRFVWEAESALRARAGQHERRRTGVQVTRVHKAATRGLDRHDGETVLSLLALTFEAGEAPAGVVTLAFSGDVTVRLEVECCEVAMADLGGAWQTPHRPAHPLDEDTA